MSKKTRKKTSKTASKTPSRPTLGKSSGASAAKASRANPAKTAAAKSRPQAATKPGKAAKKQPGKTAAAAPPKTTLKKTTLKKTSLKPAKASVASEAAPRPAVPLTEGAKAPAFRLPRDGGSLVSLSDHAGKKLVLFFYPRANTPGCTKEAIDFTRLSHAFAESKTAVLGVSADPLKAQESFRDKHDLSVPLVSDEQHEMLEAYGVWGEKSMYGKVFMGIVRTTVLIGANGRIVRIWRHVKVDGHADEVLAVARAS
jgi:thioredoxin-dependent peroxiredoxin